MGDKAKGLGRMIAVLVPLLIGQGLELKYPDAQGDLFLGLGAIATIIAAALIYHDRIAQALAGYTLQSPFRSPLVRKRLTVEELKKAIIEARISTPPAPPTSFPVWLKAALEPKVFLDDDVTPRSLVDQLEGVTELEGQDRIKKYIGTWMRVSGTFDDLSPVAWPQGWLEVELEHEPRPGNLTPVFVSGRFDESWKKRLAVLTKGTPVRISGEIESVSRYGGLRLTKCELIEPKQDGQ